MQLNVSMVSSRLSVSATNGSRPNAAARLSSRSPAAGMRSNVPGTYGLWLFRARIITDSVIGITAGSQNDAIECIHGLQWFKTNCSGKTFEQITCSGCGNYTFDEQDLGAFDIPISGKDSLEHAWEEQDLLKSGQERATPSSECLFGSQSVTQ